MPEETPNSAQAAYWHEAAGPLWVRLQEKLDLQLQGLGDAVLDVAGLAPGNRVLDVGCGCGAFSIGAAAQVAPEGRVLGVDVSGPMLARARERVAERGLPGLEFLRADAQIQPFSPGGFDRVLSRFGVMFFASPEAAFANLRRALAPGGLLAFVCWQSPGQNVWMSAPRKAAMRHLPALPPPPDPKAPGPFAFADRDHVSRILSTAGFQGITIEALEGAMSLGGTRTAEEAADFVTEMGPAGAALREAGADEATRLAVSRDVARALEPYQRSDGVHVPYAAWRVVATAPHTTEPH